MYFDNLLRNVFDDDLYRARSRVCRTSKTEKTENGLVLKIEVPGCSEEDVSVERLGLWTLVVRAEKEDLDITKTYQLPKDTDVDNIKAEVKNGLLKITIPTKKESKHKIL